MYPYKYGKYECTIRQYEDDLWGYEFTCGALSISEKRLMGPESSQDAFKGIVDLLVMAGIL